MTSIKDQLKDIPIDQVADSLGVCCGPDRHSGIFFCGKRKGAEVSPGEINHGDLS